MLDGDAVEMDCLLTDRRRCVRFRRRRVVRSASLLSRLFFSVVGGRFERLY